MTKPTFNSPFSVKRPSTQEKPKSNKVTLADFKDDTEKPVRLNLDISKQQRNKLKAYAMQNDQTMTQVICNFIDTLDER